MNSSNPVKSFGNDGRHDGVKSAEPVIKQCFNSGTQIDNKVITAYEASLVATKLNFSYKALTAFSGNFESKSYGLVAN